MTRAVVVSQVLSLGHCQPFGFTGTVGIHVTTYNDF